MEQWPCYNYGLLLHNPCVSVDRIVATKKKSRNLSHRDDKQSSDYFYSQAIYCPMNLFFTFDILLAKNIYNKCRRFNERYKKLFSKRKVGSS